MVAHLRLVTPATLTPPTVTPATVTLATEHAEEARLAFTDWYLGAELSEELAGPRLVLWAQSMAGHPAGDTALDLAGVDALLTGLDGFRVRVEHFRAQLAAGTAGATQ